MKRLPPTNDSKEQTVTNLRVPLSRPWMDADEVEAAARVVESGWLIFGPRVREFEEAFAHAVGARHAIAVNSGSAALLAAMWAVGVGSGDEVIVPDMTFVSTASAALFLGARPVFVDITLSDYAMDPGASSARISRRTKLIVPVHYAGQTAEMDLVVGLAERHGIPVLEDAAEAHLARYRGGRFAGTIGDIGIFSFTPSKPMTTGEGGMIVTDSERLAERCRLFRNFGDVDKFAWRHLGFNFRMPEVMGAIGLAQLAKLPKAVQRRREVAARYRGALQDLPGLVLPWARTPEDINYQLFTVRLDNGRARDELMAYLSKRGVSTRVYYPPLHRQPVFADAAPGHDGDFPNAVRFAETALSLPIYPGLSDDELDYVIAAVREAFEIMSVTL